MRMKQGSGLGPLCDFGDGVTERRERVKGRGYILVSHARHVRAGAGKLDRSPFFNFSGWFFSSIWAGLSQFDPFFNSRHFSPFSSRFSAFFRNYSKPTRQNKIN